MSAMAGPSVWPSKGLPCSALAWSTTWPASGLGHRRRHTHFAAELVGRSSLVLADALDLRRMQRIDLVAALAVALQSDRAGPVEQRGEARGELGVAGDLAGQEPQRPPGALELMGMAVAADHDGRAIGDPHIALAQRHAVALGQVDQLLERLVHQASVGG